jgi:hypothetical protein
LKLFLLEKKNGSQGDRKLSKSAAEEKAKLQLGKLAFCS